MRKTELNLLNTMDKWLRHDGFTINTIVILLKKTAILTFRHLLVANSMAWRVLKCAALARFRPNASSNSTVFGGDSEEKVSRYGRVLRKKAK
jgi:hypothetical protein